MEETLMRKINKLSKMWKDYGKKVGLSVGVRESYKPVLMYIGHHPGCMQKDVAEYNSFKPSTISQTLKEMIYEDLIYKITDENDSRVFKLYLTTKGESLYEKIRKILRETNDSICKKLDNEELLLEELDKLKNVLEGEIKC